MVSFLLGSVLMIPGDSNAEDAATLSNDASLSIALIPEAMNLAVTPTPDGTLASDELAIQISTDNTTGYALTLAPAGAESSLYDPTSGEEIQSTAATIENPTTLAVNTWGWYPDSLANNTGNLFSALPSNSDPYELKKTSAPTSGSGDTTTISFGVNVDTDLPAGSYTNAIVISAVTNYVPQPILDVYPTTGWAGDTITLYSNGGFINVQSVQIGGTDCTSINVKSADELTCILPSKAETNTTSGTDNGYSISVTASNTSLSTHNFTIRYFNPSTTTSMQEFTDTTCGSMSVGDIVSLTDERNGQTYRIKKMQDNKCWMVDNLKYAGEANTDLANVDGTYGLVYNNIDGKYNTVDGTSTQSTENSDKAFYNNPMSASYCYGTSIQSSYTKCGYLYNWYAATAGTGIYATSTNGANVSGSICPTGWRLPSAAYVDSLKGVYGASGYDYYEADFPILNTSMNAGILSIGEITSSYYAGWQFSGAWSGVFSGYQIGNFSNQGSYGGYWSSSMYTSSMAHGLRLNSYEVVPNYVPSKYTGLAVRCLIGNDGLMIIEDVYPTTGWSGDTIKITLSRIPDVTINSVTIGGTACTSISISDNIISCTLPSKPENTSDGYAISILADGGMSYDRNFTIRYFDRSRSETVGSTTTSDITMQSFTQSNCNSMTVGQVVSLTDARNNQTYRIKKMEDNKCWMVDNLKYAGEANTDLANVDGTYGLVYNNESGRENTVDGTSKEDAANMDKAFYNIPMSIPYCYGDSIQDSYTKCGYLYNWYAATAGTGTYNTSDNTNVSGSICPTGWRLPSAKSDGSTATGNGNSYTAADFPILNASMNAGYLTSGSTDNYYTGWQFTGTWFGVFSGYSRSEIADTGRSGQYWSSTSGGWDYGNASALIFKNSGVDFHERVTQFWGLAIRCVMEEPPAIQDFTVDECQAKASDTNFTVVDKRDGNDYTVRYINGNCWMTQNLRLSGGRTLTPADSNVASSWSFQSTELAGNSYSYTAPQSTISSNTSYGGYYNFCAASAGTVCSTTKQDAVYDICPKGWRLPTYNEQQGITSYSSAFSPVYSGYYDNGSLYTTGFSGYWWSSTAYDNYNQYRLNYYSGSLDPYLGYKNLGFSVRCVRSS